MHHCESKANIIYKGTSGLDVTKEDGERKGERRGGREERKGGARRKGGAGLSLVTRTEAQLHPVALSSLSSSL